MKNRKIKFNRKTIFHAGNAFLIIALMIGVYIRVQIRSSAPAATDGSASKKEAAEIAPHPSYMIYYGELDEELIRKAQQYDLVILHPKSGDLTREQVAQIQSNGNTRVLAYLSVGEDLRTAGMSPEEMKIDENERFTGDKTGPRVDARKDGDKGLANVDLAGDLSPGGTGFASYYLDDNDHDGKPDFNPKYGCAYTNIGDPAWYEVLEEMQLDGMDKAAGIREILTTDFGRGLGCDGLFLDTIDTCAPNSYTDDLNPGKTRFEWTAPGVIEFMKHLKEDYPDKYVLQNKGLFFYNYKLPHFNYSPREYVDLVMFESYRLDNSADALYSEEHFADNRDSYMPKLSAEANRPDGFKILSLGYAEGPSEYQLKESLRGFSTTGLDILKEEMLEAEDKAGFSHYITDASLLLQNDFILERQTRDERAPEWSSVHMDNLSDNHIHTGIGEVVPTTNGVTVRWDVALDKNGVTYTLYYQKTPFDFTSDPDLTGAESVELKPETGKGYRYNASEDTFPYEDEVTGLDGGETYYFVIRARDNSPLENEEKNTVSKKGVPLE